MAKKQKANVTVSADEEWQVASDLRVLSEAREIRADAKRMAKVRALARKKLGEIASLASDHDGDGDC